MRHPETDREAGTTSSGFAQSAGVRDEKPEHYDRYHPLPIHAPGSVTFGLWPRFSPVWATRMLQPCH